MARFAGATRPEKGLMATDFVVQNKMYSITGCLFFKERRGSRRYFFGERISACDKPENLVLGAAAKGGGTRARLTSRDKSCPVFEGSASFCEVSRLHKSGISWRRDKGGQYVFTFFSFYCRGDQWSPLLRERDFRFTFAVLLTRGDGRPMVAPTGMVFISLILIVLRSYGLCSRFGGPWLDATRICRGDQWSPAFRRRNLCFSVYCPF